MIQNAWNNKKTHLINKKGSDEFPWLEHVHHFPD